MSVATYRTRFGTGAVHFDGARLLRIELPSDLPAQPSDAVPPAIRHVTATLEAYYEGTACLLPSAGLIAAAGSTGLSRDIYAQVSAIRPGATMTYGDVAAAVGRPGAARAVGAAMARNPFPPLIPCHRVVGSDGRLRGYGGGLDQKRRLLEMEAAHAR